MLQTIVSLEFPALSFIFAPSITFFNREFILVDRSVRIRLTRNHSDVTRLPRARLFVAKSSAIQRARFVSCASIGAWIGFSEISGEVVAGLLPALLCLSLPSLLGRQCSSFIWNPGCHLTIEACLDLQTECRLILLTREASHKAPLLCPCL